MSCYVKDGYRSPNKVKRLFLVGEPSVGRLCVERRAMGTEFGEQGVNSVF